MISACSLALIFQTVSVYRPRTEGNFFFGGGSEPRQTILGNLRRSLTESTLNLPELLD